MIQTLPCPGCHRTLVLTSEPSMQAVLRCRHCSHQFVLGEMVDAVLGYWEVVDDPNAPELKEKAPENVVAEVAADVAADDAVLELSMSKEYESPQALLKKQAEAKNVDWSKFEPISHEQYERMRRKGKSPIWSMLSVLLGGLASIPIATLLIWHVLGKDPLQMGPSVAKYAPWIVPMRFRPSAENFDGLNSQSAPPAGASGFRKFDNELNASPSDSTESADGAASNRSPDADSLGSTTAQSRPFRIRDRRVPRAFPAPSETLPEGATNNESTTASPAEPEEPSDVFTIINRVEKDLESWNERGEDVEVHKKLALQTYSDLASLAIAIDQLPANSPLRRLVRTELYSVGQQVAQHPDIKKLIQSGSRYWLSNHPDGLVGLAMVVNVASGSEAESIWNITPTTAASEEALSISVPKEILTSVSSGQNIFVLGCLTRSKSASNADPSESSPKSPSVLTANHVHVLEP